MQLPDDSIGVSDLKDHLECPRRMVFKQARHTSGEAPEARGKAGVKDPTSAYGSAVHEAIFLIEEEAYRDEEAIEAAFQKFAAWLEPVDLDHLRDDIATYRKRDYQGVRTVMNEAELRVPLMQYEGRTVYFRCKIDRLYQRLDNPSVFVHLDWKTSKWMKSQQEVHEDIQLWAYNFAIHEHLPECEHLQQVYDQLLGGALTTSKNDEQRATIKRWLQQAALRVLRDETHEPTWNEFCAWCPIMLDCEEIPRLAQWSLDEIAVLEKPIIKADGTPGKRTAMKLDPDNYADYVSKLPKVKSALRALKKFDELVKGDLVKMPAERRQALGYGLRDQRRTTWTPEGLRALHEEMGPDLFEMLGLTKSAIEDHVPKDDRETLDLIMGHAEERLGNPQVVELAE